MFEFVELEGFADDWKDLGHDDTDFFKLQDLILAWKAGADNSGNRWCAKATLCVCQAAIRQAGRGTRMLRIF